MVAELQLFPDFFLTPANFVALPELWLQAIELQPLHDKMAKIFYLIAAVLLRRGEADIQRTLDGVARSMTLRLAEHLAQYISGLMRQASELATSHTQCLLYATYWVRPILAELLGAAREDPGPNRNRAPSGPVKAMVSPNPHSSSRWCHRS